jgi:hypothetical protein
MNLIPDSTAQAIHRAALEKALAAKKARALALLKVAESKEVSASDVDIAKMNVLRKALGACANRACLFSTPAYCYNTAFSPESYPDDADWVERGGLSSSDKVLDIGCGDGRTIIRAAEMGASAVGYEINEDRATEAVANVAACAEDIQQRVEVYALNCIEVIDTQLADGITFVFLYLTPRGLKKCLKYFRANPTPLRVVSYVNPFRELQKDGGAKVPCRKIWCEPDDPKEREMGIKFPIFCYTFGGDDDGSGDGSDGGTCTTAELSN